jgi:mRNA-degrading endonuclease RelE of RelBE toxin-antitoxin system
MFDPDNYRISIAEMGCAKRDLDSVLSEHERDQLIDWLALNPDAGDIIQGTNGVRKARWAYGGKGKRGGIRIIYYFRDLNMPIYLIAVYKKNEKLNITTHEKKVISQMVDEIVEHWASRREHIVKECAG